MLAIGICRSARSRADCACWLTRAPPRSTFLANAPPASLYMIGSGISILCRLAGGALAQKVERGESVHDWFRNFDLVLERYRGLDDHEDHLHAGTFRAVVAPGESATIVLTTGTTAGFDGESAWERQAAHEQALLDRWRAAQPQVSEESPAWIKELVLAAGQFIVRRPLPEDAEALSMIAGYHWFCDWGRDTMIALPSLTLTTGRPEVARKILSTFTRFVERGMLPNVFPDTGETPEYNTVDATLWYFEALRQCWEATRDAEFLDRLYPVLAEIIDWHVRGTRFNIHVDPGDGLLFAGEPGVQLTWMDAKVGDRSEEHTSELQSLAYLVCRLLLEKKKKKLK